MEIKHFDLIVDGHHGQYVPMVFTKLYPSYMEGSERDILLAGPEHENYWDVWSDIQGSECWDGDIWQGESGDVFIISNSPMQALVEAWESMEELENCPTELCRVVQKLASEFLTDRDEFISEDEALQHFPPSKYNDALINKALEWMNKELAEVRNG